MKDLKLVYKADTEELALKALDELEETWAVNIRLQLHHGETIGHSYLHTSNIPEK